MVGLAAAGLVDFKEARPLDRRWNLRLRWLCEAYQARTQVRIYDRLHDRALAAMSYGQVEMFNKSSRHARRLLTEIERLERPWATGKRGQPAHEDADLFEAYKTAWGDMADPTYRIKAEEVARRIRSGDF